VPIETAKISFTFSYKASAVLSLPNGSKIINRANKWNAYSSFARTSIVHS